VLPFLLSQLLFHRFHHFTYLFLLFLIFFSFGLLVCLRKHKRKHKLRINQCAFLAYFQQSSNDSHVYECLSSSPECDSNLELRHANGNRGEFRVACKRKSDSSAMETNVESRFHHQPFVRSTSLPYCGSETESELYAPYIFYTNDEVHHCDFLYLITPCCLENVIMCNHINARASRKIRIGRIEITSRG